MQGWMQNVMWGKARVVDGRCRQQSETASLAIPATLSVMLSVLVSSAVLPPTSLEHSTTAQPAPLSRMPASTFCTFSPGGVEPGMEYLPVGGQHACSMQSATCADPKGCGRLRGVKSLQPSHTKASEECCGISLRTLRVRARHATAPHTKVDKR